MNDTATRVLAVTDSEWLRDRLGNILGEKRLDLVKNLEDGLEVAQENEYEIVVFAFGDSGITEFLSSIRGPRSASRRTALVMLAEPQDLERAEWAFKLGVCRILNPLAAEERLERAFGEILDHDPRVKVRALVRIQPQDGATRTKLMAQTENLSASGMLIRFDKILPIGSRFGFDLEIPNLGRPIRGVGAVVRLTHGTSESVQGFGARFVSFQADGGSRLQTYVDEQAQTRETT